MNYLKKLFPFIIILALSIFAIKPFLTPGIFTVHDDTQVTRVFEMANAIKDGMLPVRWSQDLGFGFGYPIFNFYAPLSYYTGAVINLIGVNALDSTKIMMMLGIALSGLFMYIFAKDFFGKAGGILSALLYIFAPYHAVDIFVRGDVAEFWAYAFIPLLFYGIYRIYKTNEFKYIAISALGFAGIVLSHNLTALMVTPFTLIFAAILIYKDKTRFNNMIVSFILGTLLSAFYFIPALLEMKYTNVLSQIGGGADFKDHFVCLSQLWSSPWGYGGSTQGCLDGLSFMIGKYHIVLASALIVFVLIGFIYKKFIKLTEAENKNIPIYLLFAVFSLLCVLLMTSSSQFFWEAIKPMEFLQYPWRFLLILSFFVSFLGGGVLWLISKIIKGNWFYLSCVILFVGIVFVNMKFFVPQKDKPKNLAYYTNISSINWNISSISSEYMPKDFSKPKNPSDVAKISSIKNVNVKTFNQKTNELDLNVQSKDKALVTVPIAYFPAWKAYVDDKEVPVSSVKVGMQISIPSGDHFIKFKFKQTSIELLSNLISIAGLVILLLGIIYPRIKNDKV